MMKLCFALIVVLWICTAVAIDRYVIACNHGCDHLNSIKLDSLPIEVVEKKSVAIPAAPPEWSERLIVAVDNLPLVGPIVSKVILYLGIVSSILTTIVAMIHTLLNLLLGISNAFGQINFSRAISRFKEGRIMYVLKFFSLFNAKKRVRVEPLFV